MRSSAVSASASVRSLVAFVTSQVRSPRKKDRKTKARLRIPLPSGLMEILEHHVNNLPEGRTSKSDLLFPSKTGSYQASSCLAKPIVAIADAAEINKHLSPYFMRRTFQDLCRAAQGLRLCRASDQWPRHGRDAAALQQRRRRGGPQRAGESHFARGISAGQGN